MEKEKTISSVVEELAPFIKEFRKRFHQYEMEDPRQVLLDGVSSGEVEDFITQIHDQAFVAGRVSVLEDFDSVMKADAFMGLSDEEWKAVQKFFRYNDEISGWKVTPQDKEVQP